jgi:alkaline phosphatase D
MLTSVALLPLLAAAQLHVNGPMVGHVDMLEARIWMQCLGPCSASLAVWPAHAPDSVMHLPLQHSDAATAHTLTFVAGGLRPGTTYQYQPSVNGRALAFAEPLTFRTQPLWRWRTDPPEFTLAMGSCAYINEPAYDRPGRPYGDGYPIFDAIAAKSPDLMLWLGDNVYLREPDWGSRSGYLHRYTYTRSTPEIGRAHV